MWVKKQTDSFDWVDNAFVLLITFPSLSFLFWQFLQWHNGPQKCLDAKHVHVPERHPDCWQLQCPISCSLNSIGSLIKLFFISSSFYQFKNINENKKVKPNIRAHIAGVIIVIMINKNCWNLFLRLVIVWILATYVSPNGERLCFNDSVHFFKF